MQCQTMHTIPGNNARTTRQPQCIISHSMFKKLMEQNPCPLEKVRQKYDKINDMITVAMLYAKKKHCRAQYTHPWSPKLAEAGQEIIYWTKCLHCLTTGKELPPNPALIPSQITATIGIPTISVAKRRLREGWQQLKNVQKNAEIHHQKFLKGQVNVARKA